MNPFPFRCPSVLLALLALLGVAAGCSSRTPEDSSLDVRLINLRFAQATVLETTVVADLRLENIAPEDVEITGAAHKIVANGRRLGRGLSSTSLVVPRLGTVVQSVELRLGNISVARTLDEVARTHLVDYQLETTLYVKRGGSRERSVTLVRSGILDLSRMAVERGR